MHALYLILHAHMQASYDVKLYRQRRLRRPQRSKPKNKKKHNTHGVEILTNTGNVLSGIRLK